MTTIRPLEVSNAGEFVALRRNSLTESPFAFASSPEDDRAGTVEAVEDYIRSSRNGTILGAFEPRLAGMVGLLRGRSRSTAHRIRIWGLYVTPNVRRRGLARKLVEEALRQAAVFPGATWVDLDVTAEAPAARQLYESLGFRCWGTQPAGFQKLGRLLDVHHYAIPLHQITSGRSTS